jgi:hypothetical protein
VSRLRGHNPALVFGLLVAATSSCGGTDEGRPTSGFKQVATVDIGSQQVVCGVTDEYDFLPVADFELGSVTGGWYFNNDRCDKCQQALDRIKLIEANIPRAKSLTGEPVDKRGCPVEKELVLTDWTDELALLKEAVDEGDAQRSIPANCREVCNESQTPNAFVKPLAASRIAFDSNGDGKLEDQPRCGSRYAMHVVGGPFETWGGVFAAQFGSPGLDLDTSDKAGGVKWEGLSFWARVAPDSRSSLRIELADEHTDDKQKVYDGELVSSLTSDEMTEWCKNPTYVCNGDSTRESTDGCDKFGANRAMTSDWEFFTFKFDTLRQSGWGQVALDENGRQVGLDINQLRSLTFLWTTGNWDVWIDDIAFYRRKQP